MLAPAVAAGKGVKGEKECRHCLRFHAQAAFGGLRNSKSIVARRPALWRDSSHHLSSPRSTGLATFFWRNFRNKERGNYLYFSLPHPARARKTFLLP